MNKNEIIEAKNFFIDGDMEKGFAKLKHALQIAEKTEKAVNDIKRWRSGMETHDSRRGGVDRCLTLLTASEIVKEGT